MTGPALALIALVPLILGAPPQQTDEAAITVALCNGGTITLDLGQRDGERAPPRDCHPKGCHSGTCRERAKPRAAG